MHSIPPTTTTVDFAWVTILVATALFVLLVLLAIGISAWMKRRQMPVAARTIVITLAVFVVLPVAVFLGLGVFWVHTPHQVVAPAEERAAIEIIDNVHHTVTSSGHTVVSSGNLPQLPTDAFHGQVGWQHAPDVIVQQTHGTPNKAVWLGGAVLLVPVLVLVCIAIGIGVHVWMRHRGKSFSVGAVIVVCASILWLLPVIAVLAYVGLKVSASPLMTSSEQPTFNLFTDLVNLQSARVATAERVEQQAQVAKVLAEEARARNLAVAEAGKKLALEQMRQHSPLVTTIEPQPVRTEPIPQAPPAASAAGSSAKVSEPQPPGTEALPQTPPATAEKPSEAQPQAPPVAEAAGSDKQPNAPSSVPDWVTRGSVRDGDRTLAVVSSQQFANEQEARVQAMQQAGVLTTVAFHSRYPQARSWQVPESAVDGLAVQQSFVEAIDRKVSTSGTPFRMYRVHLQVESSERVNQTIFPMWNQQVVRRRLATLMAVGVLLTLIFATTSAYLRLNDWTKGAYRGRLRLAAVSLIVAVGLITAFLS